MTTSQITKEAISRLSALGYKVWRQNNVRVPGRAFVGQLGLSDIQGYKIQGGTAIYCEVKGPGDKLSNAQIEFLWDAHNAGCFALVAHQVDGKVVIMPIAQYNL